MATCYDLSGFPLDASYQPCDADAAESPCCRLNQTDPDVCLGNGLCLSTEQDYAGEIWADGCTARSGTNPVCPDICEGLVNPTTFWSVVFCPGEFQHWCCRPGEDVRSCCDDEARTVYLTTEDIRPMPAEPVKVEVEVEVEVSVPSTF